MVKNDIQLLHCATESHWQLGRVEVANRVLRGMAQKVWQDTDRPAAEVIEICASVRNQQLRKHGYSPCQWFLGQDTKHPGMLYDVDEQPDLILHPRSNFAQKPPRHLSKNTPKTLGEEP